jgi:NDP-sugar pyrophosphorylase family protein
MKAVIQSGGKGTRLKPYTMILPKPLMPVGSKPVLELLLKWLRRNGIRQVIITTGYLGHLIRSVCGDGRQWDLSLKYTAEPKIFTKRRSLLGMNSPRRSKRSPSLLKWLG